MAAANENVRFNINDDDNIEDNDELQDCGDGQQEVPPFVIPEGVDQATANLLHMQMNMMQTLMANQMAQMEKWLEYERRERKQSTSAANSFETSPSRIGRHP